MKYLIYLLILICIPYISCKKQTNNTSSSNNTAAIKVLPDEYVILTDNGKTDTIAGYLQTYYPGWFFGPNNSGIKTDSNMNYEFVGNGYNENNQFTNLLHFMIPLPTDSARMKKFPIGTYKTVALALNNDITINNNAGVLGFYRNYTNGSYLSLTNNSVNIYYNKIKSLTYLKSSYNSNYGRMEPIFVIEGEFKVNTKSNVSNLTKDYLGKYKFTLRTYQTIGY